MATRVRTLLLAMLLCLVLPGAALACPACKDAIAESGPNAGNLVRGYYWSILFMMSMPFLILGGLVSYFYFEVRRARARMAIAPRPASDVPVGAT